MIREKDNASSFYAKVLLFGEYSVIFDSMGLSIPYTHFKGELSFINEDKYTDIDYAKASNQHLQDFCKWMQEQENKGKVNIDLNQFQTDISNGLYFESSIPQGYGIGSSGALVAAIYERYAKQPILADRNMSSADINGLREIFSIMESYFHGKSSGLDPLNAYLKYPILINGKNDLSITGIPRNKHEKEAAIFLIDTNQIGKTSPLVNWFLEQCQEEEYMKKVENELIPANNQCVKAMVKGNSKQLFASLKSLSELQLDMLQPMIPESAKEVWKKGLQTKCYYLKLCGSGGGGFLLGFTENLQLCEHILQEYNYTIIQVYRNK